jgi:DDE superfamily endonuclease/Tc5 transposase DNA-binding domain
MPLPKQAESSNREGRLLLAKEAIEQGQIQSIRAAADAYDVAPSTLSSNIRGVPLRSDCIPNCRKLSLCEEEAIVQYILDLDSRGFPPRPQDVREMADLLLAERDASPVGKNWPTNFINRRSEIQSKFNRKYDYKRALCEDLVVIGEWFRLVHNVKAKYGILDEDIYNFDEASFQMGVIGSARVVTSSEARSRPKPVQPGNHEWVSIIQGVNSMGWTIPPYVIFKGEQHLSAWYEDNYLPSGSVITLSENGWTTNEIGFEWIQHFDKHTKHRTKGKYRLLILDGHESHISVQFQQYYKEHEIIALCMPPHSSHLLQPLDVGCFSPMKTSYGFQIEKFMRFRINHITKLEFLPAFGQAFTASFTEKNIKAGFKAAGLVPYNPERVISCLDLRLKTPTPPPQDINWVSKTPQNADELKSQTEHIQSKIVRHQNSSPTSIYEALGQLAKGAQIIAHSAILIKAELKASQEANQAKKRRARKQKRRIMYGSSLTIEEGENIVQNAAIEAQIHREITGGEGPQHRCSSCKNIGHNSRTCEKRQQSSVIN